MEGWKTHGPTHWFLYKCVCLSSKHVKAAVKLQACQWQLAKQVNPCAHPVRVVLKERGVFFFFPHYLWPLLNQQSKTQFTFLRRYYSLCFLVHCRLVFLMMNLNLVCGESILSLLFLSIFHRLRRVWLIRVKAICAISLALKDQRGVWVTSFSASVLHFLYLLKSCAYLFSFVTHPFIHAWESTSAFFPPLTKNWNCMRSELFASSARLFHHWFQAYWKTLLRFRHFFSQPPLVAVLRNCSEEQMCGCFSLREAAIPMHLLFFCMALWDTSSCPQSSSCLTSWHLFPPVSVLVQGCKSDLDRPASPLCVWPFQPLHIFGKPQCSSVLSCPKLDPPKKAPANTMGSVQLVACSDLLLAIPLLQGNDWFIWPEEGCCHMIWRPSPPRIDTLSPSGSHIEAPHCSHLSGHHALIYCVLQSVQPVPWYS